jgi:hypothetical protein
MPTGKRGLEVAMFSRISLLLAALVLVAGSLLIGCEKKKAPPEATAAPQESAALADEAQPVDEAAPEEGAWAEPAGEDPEPEADEGVAAPMEDEADEPIDEEQ